MTKARDSNLTKEDLHAGRSALHRHYFCHFADDVHLCAVPGSDGSRLQKDRPLLFASEKSRGLARGIVLEICLKVAHKS
ncbi:hypothetical protein [Tunturiibacter lichenicola]|uniref:hypothetical protein n=1 Tax=Tunturiibacter lichenicola TaxID=2051959 RepID=UPI0021B333DA|nr:hypothetical protein [Edaphobacter lichenicola]